MLTKEITFWNTWRVYLYLLE